MNPLTPFLESHGVVILDGGLATELECRGADLRDPLWSAKLLIENPDLIRQVHYDYFAAGADVATTASYQATIPGLMRRGLDRSQAENVLRLSVSLAQQARRDFLAAYPHSRLRPLVAASIGCYGVSLHDGSEYRGDYGLTVPQLIDWHRPRFDILADSGADLFACETIPSIAEAEALVALFEEYSHMNGWLSFSCRDAKHVCHGEPFAKAVQLANAAPNIMAVGVNCTSPRFIDGLLELADSLSHKPLIVYPNSGEAWDGTNHRWHGGKGEFDWGEAAVRWHRAGAIVIGGCCRTSPDTIRKIAGALTSSGVRSNMVSHHGRKEP